jgi:hypothetical protein
LLIGTFKVDGILLKHLGQLNFILIKIYVNLSFNDVAYKVF